MSQFHSLIIKSIERVTDKSVAITFDIPENLKEKFSFKAGQYITLKNHYWRRRRPKRLLHLFFKKQRSTHRRSKSSRKWYVFYLC